MQRAAFFSTLFFLFSALTYGNESPSVKEIILTSASQEGFQTPFTSQDRRITATVVIETQAPTHIHIDWYHNGSLYAQIPVQIKQAAQAWRARSYVHALPGQWEVRVMQGDTQVLGQTSFEVTDTPLASTAPSAPRAKPKQIKSVKEVLRALEPANK